MSVDQIKVACEHSQTHIVQGLIEMNLDRMRDDLTVADVLMMIFKVRLSMGIMQSLLAADVLLMIHRVRVLMHIMQSLASRGFFDPLTNADQDFEVLTDHISTDMDHVVSKICLSLVAIRQDIFELYLQTSFPFWYTLRPRREQEILESVSAATGWIDDTVRLLVRSRGSIQAIDTRTGIKDAASLLHLVLYSYFDSCRPETISHWHYLLQKTITAPDDLHYMLEWLSPFGEINGACSALKLALVLTLNNIFDIGHDSPGDTETQNRLKQLTANLQSLMSMIASFGHDLLEFGRREAAIWVGQDDTCRITKEALIFEPNNRFRKSYGRWCLWMIHYGPQPLDWYFEWEFPQEDYAGEFWTLVERPPPTPPTPIPGAWVDGD